MGLTGCFCHLCVVNSCLMYCLSIYLSDYLTYCASSSSFLTCMFLRCRKRDFCGFALSVTRTYLKLAPSIFISISKSRFNQECKGNEKAPSARNPFTSSPYLPINLVHYTKKSSNFAYTEFTLLYFTQSFRIGYSGGLRREQNGPVNSKNRSR